MNAIAIFVSQFRREMRLYTRQLRLTLNSALFFLMIVVFFPLSMPADAVFLKQAASGLVWMALLLAILLSCERLYQQDNEDGVIEQWLVSGLPVSLFVAAKFTAHWLWTVLPVLMACPILALLFSYDLSTLCVLMLSLLLGSPALLALAALASAFAHGIEQRGVLMALILMPLTVPVLIFGSGTLIAHLQGGAVQGHLALLLALSILSFTLLPLAVAAVLRAEVSY